MPKLGSVLGANRTGHKDATNSVRGKSRGRGGVNGTKPHTSRRTAASGRGKGRTQSARPADSNAGAELGKPTLADSTLSSDSPFAQIKQSNNNAFPSANGSSSSIMFGKPSPVPGTTISNGFGAPSVVPKPMGTHVDSTRDSRPRAASKRPVHKKSTVSPNIADGAKPIDYQERYEKLKIDRVKQHERAAKQAQTADPNKQTSQANTPVGTCTAMCPEFERVERIVQKMVDKSEKSLDPSTGTFEVQELKMLKRFRRSAAGYDEQLPSDIRTPATLLQTMNYLIRHVISGPEPLGLIHKFVWDRTRSIRNDFSVQQLTGVDDVKMATKCLERIARFHIVSLHLLSSPDNEEQFDHHQEREQLNNTMLSLMHYYDDNRKRINFPNESEFRAYYIILAIHDQRPDIEDRVQRWPQEILESPKVQVALDLLAAASNSWDYQSVLEEVRPAAIAQGFYERFFSLVDSPSVSYLMGCVAEIYFSSVRQTAIRSIWKAYCRVPMSQQHKNEDWTLEELTRILYFDDDAQTEEFLEEQGLQLMERDDGTLYLNWGSNPIDSVDFKPSSQHVFSENYVEVKRGGRTLAAIILGMNIEQAAARGMIDMSLIESPASTMSEIEDDNELFVHQDEQDDFQQVEAGAGATSYSAPSNQPSQPSLSPFLSLENVDHSQKPLFHSSGVEPVPLASQNSLATSIPTTTSTETSKPTFSWPSSINNTSVTSGPSSTNPFAQTSHSLFSRPLSSQGPSTTLAAPAPATSVEPSKPLFSWSPAFPKSTSSDPFSNTTATTQESQSLFSFTSSSATSQSAIPQVSTKTTSAKTSIFPSLGPKTSANPSVVSEPSVVAPSSPAPAPLQPASLPSESSTPPKFLLEAQPATSQVSSNQSGIPHASAVTSNPEPTDDVVVAHSEESHPPFVDQPVSDNLSGVEPSAKVETSTGKEHEEFRKSWIETLRQAAMSNRTSISNRKRALETEEVQELSARKPDAPPSKVQKAEAEEVLKPEPARQKPKKTSLALASIAPLPTLPILEEVKKMTQPKKRAEDEVESSKASQIDEDELLLSAARIAAEQLKNGPKLMESTPDYSYADSFRSSTYLGRSINSASRSHSASPYARINGYDVALAPETPLGLGRTLSRTEQRLRLTGGRGLAYKPLQLTPDKKKETEETGETGKRKKLKNRS